MLETYIGLCVMCGGVDETRKLPGGSCDSICEHCDQVRFTLLNPNRQWRSWAARKADAAARAATRTLVRTASPADQVVDGAPFPVRRAS